MAGRPGGAAEAAELVERQARNLIETAKSPEVTEAELRRAASRLAGLQAYLEIYAPDAAATALAAQSQARQRAAAGRAQAVESLMRSVTGRLDKTAPESAATGGVAAWAEG